MATDDVFLKRTRDGFLVLTKDPWELFYEGIDEMSESAFEEERRQLPIEDRDDFSDEKSGSES